MHKEARGRPIPPAQAHALTLWAALVSPAAYASYAAVVQVAAIIAVYRGAAPITEVVDSALSQTRSGLKVIFTDAGSTGATRQILSGYRDRVEASAKSNRGLV